MGGTDFGQVPVKGNDARRSIPETGEKMERRTPTVRWLRGQSHSALQHIDAHTALTVDYIPGARRECTDGASGLEGSSAPCCSMLHRGTEHNAA